MGSSFIHLRFLTTGPPGKSLYSVIFKKLSSTQCNSPNVCQMSKCSWFVGCLMWKFRNSVQIQELAIERGKQAANRDLWRYEMHASGKGASMWEKNESASESQDRLEKKDEDESPWLAGGRRQILEKDFLCAPSITYFTSIHPYIYWWASGLTQLVSLYYKWGNWGNKSQSYLSSMTKW